MSFRNQWSRWCSMASPKQMQLHNTYTIYCPYILRKRLLVQLQTGKHDSYRTMIKGAGVKSQLLHYDWHEPCWASPWGTGVIRLGWAEFVDNATRCCCWGFWANVCGLDPDWGKRAKKLSHWAGEVQAKIASLENDCYLHQSNIVPGRPSRKPSDIS